jgi:hypothetical protein
MSLSDQTSNQYFGPDLINDLSNLVLYVLFPNILISLIVDALPSLMFKESSIILFSNSFSVTSTDEEYLPLSKYSLTNSCLTLSMRFYYRVYFVIFRYSLEKSLFDLIQKLFSFDINT